MEGVPTPDKRAHIIESSAEKFEKIERAKEVYDELLQFEKVVDREEYERVKLLTAELHTYMLDDELSWSDLVHNGLPWDPRLEILREQQRELKNTRSLMS